MRTKFLTALVLLFLPASLALADSLPQTLRDSQDTQQQIRQSARQVASELDTLIDEYRRNGLTQSPDLITLIKVRGVLSHLSEREMTQVIDTLQSAAQQSVPAALHAAATAHSQQTDIITQLDAVLREYQRQQSLEALAAHLEDLANREDGNLDNAWLTDRKSTEHGHDELQDGLQVQVNEQESLRSDVTNTLTDLATALQDADPDEVVGIKAAINASDTDHLLDQISQAASELGNWHIKSAATDERAVRDELRDMSRLVAGPRDTETKIKDAIEKINDSINKQKQVADQTKSADLSDPANPPQATTDQRKLIDQTDRTRQDIADIAPAAADALKQAQDAMQQARQAMDQNQPGQAAAAQQAALAQLQNALAAAQAVAQQDQQPQSPQDPQSQLADLQKKTQNLKSEEQAELAKATATTQPVDQQAASDQQAVLRQAAQDLQRQSAALSQPATAALAQAADQMDKAATELNPKQAPDPQSAAANEQQAITNLDQAAQQLAQDQQQLQQEQNQASQTQQQLTKLADVIAAQQSLTQAAANPASDSPAAADQLAGDQAKIGQATDQLATQLPSADSQAKTPLNDATQNMSAAASSLHQGDPKSAEPQAKDALTDLYKAKQTLQEKLDDLNQDLGNDASTPQQQQQLAQQIEDAQKAITKAQGELSTPDADQSAAQQAAADLGAAAHKVGELAAKPTGAPPEAEQAIEAAQQSLSDATGQKGDQAVSSAAQAQAELAQAQAAMTITQSAQAASQEQGLLISGVSNNASGGRNVQDTGAPRAAITSPSAYIGLPSRDRQALLQSQADKYPQSYGSQIEQYRRNLSDQDADGAGQ